MCAVVCTFTMYSTKELKLHHVSMPTQFFHGYNNTVHVVAIAVGLGGFQLLKKLFIYIRVYN